MNKTAGNMRFASLSLVFLHDELMMVAEFADHFTAPIATGVIRKIGEALIDLPAESENISGIWLFFRSYKKDGYTGDQYLGYNFWWKLLYLLTKINL